MVSSHSVGTLHDNFDEIGPVSSAKHDTPKYSSQVPKSNSSTILSPTAVEEIAGIIGKLNITGNTDQYSVSAEILKSFFPVIESNLFNNISRSTEKRIIPIVSNF